MKPVLLLDQDGPLADFDAAFHNYCLSHGFALNITGLDDLRRQRFMTDNMPHGADRELARTRINETHWFRTLPVTEGALEHIHELEEVFDVWVCTKPLEQNPYCRDDKAAWIGEFFPQFINKLIMAPKKSMVHGAILLDDAPRLECIPVATWKPVIFESVFNGDHSEWAGIPSWTWGDDVQLLLDLAK